MNIHDFLTTQDMYDLARFIPKNREEYLQQAQIAYNLKLNTTVPSTVHIEPANICNQRCRMCVYPDMKRSKQLIDTGLALKAIDECAEIGVYAVHFFFFGEPFANKNTLEYMKYAKNKGIPLVSTTTNFTLVGEKEIEQLVDYQVDSVHVSFHGLNRERYMAIHGVDEFEKARGNILALLCERERRHSAKPWVSLTYVRTDESDDDIRRFKEEWGRRVNDIHISPQFDYLGRAPIRRDQQAVNSEGILDRDPEHRLPCRQLWLRLVVLSNGELVPCSQNIDGELSVGNLQVTTLREAWNGKRMLQLRAQHLTNSFEAGCICRNCMDWDWSGKVDKRARLK